MRTASIFKDRSKLLPGYVPERLVNREDEYRNLIQLFRPVLADGTSQRALVHGPGGSGKTALALRFCEELEKAADRRNVDLNCAYVDCRRYDTRFKVAWKLTDRLGLDLPPRGHSTTHYLDWIAERLEGEDSHLVVILDWLDFQVRRGDSDLPYFLTRWWEGRDGENRISVIGLSRIADLTRRMDRTARSTFMHNRVRLEEYAKNELRDILWRRAELSFRPGSVEESAIEMISRSSPSVDGARLGIEWLREAGAIASGKGKEKVTPREVREAEQLVHKKVSKRDLKNLGEHELLLLLALSIEMELSRQDPIPTGRVEERYGKICGRRKIEAYGYDAIMKKVRRMTDLGIVGIEPFGAGGCHKVYVHGNSPDLIMDVVLELL